MAVHAFIEAYAREWLGRFERDDYYNDLVRNLRLSLSLPQDKENAMYDLVEDLMRAHRSTNDVRHQFAELTREDALVSFYMLEKFIELVGIDCGDRLELLRQSLEVWGSRKSHFEDTHRLREVERVLHSAGINPERLEQELEKWSQLAEVRIALQSQVDELSAELARKKDEATDEIGQLTERRSDLIEHIKEMSRQMESHERAELFVESLLRMTSLTRTRRDFERNATRLTPEQHAVLDEMSLDADFLVQGGPGTGKSLILIEAMRKLVDKSKTEKVNQPSLTFVLLTYTNTLVKYDRYLATIMVSSGGSLEAEISTVDSFILDALRRHEPGARIIYSHKVIGDLLESIGIPGFIKSDQLVVEIEETIYANALKKNVYIEKGETKHWSRLNRAQRELVWDIGTKLAANMRRSQRYSKNYSRIRLLEHFTNKRENMSTRDYIFLDEIQDLPSVDIVVLAALKKRALLMAGDIGQAIYRMQHSLENLGVDIRGRIRALHTNFRNTEQIGFVTTTFKRLGNIETETDDVGNAFRQGPTPELHLIDSQEQVHRTILNRIRVLHSELGYSYENIGVMGSTKNALGKLSEFLLGHNISAVSMTDGEFSFDSSTGIRLSTIHSSKGIDLPAVILVLDHLPGVGEDYRDSIQLQRNLVYVAMTRAMDYLCVIMPPSGLGSVGEEIKMAFEKYKSEWLSIDAEEAQAG